VKRSVYTLSVFTYNESEIADIHGFESVLYEPDDGRCVVVEAVGRLLESGDGHRGCCKQAEVGFSVDHFCREKFLELLMGVFVKIVSRFYDNLIIYSRDHIEGGVRT
jgi:hypothetical protein